MSSPLLKRAAFIPRATTKPSFLSSSTTNSDQDDTVSKAVTALLHHRSKSRWSTLKSLFPNGFTPSQISQIILQIRNNPHLSHSFFTFALPKSPKHPSSSLPTLHCYATLIHILGRARLKSRARFLIKEALRISHLDDHDDGSHQRPKLFFRVLVDTYRVCNSSPVVFDLFLKSLLELNKIDPCVEIVRLLMPRGFYPHGKTCNALVSAACRSKGCFFGYDLYRELFRFNHDDCDSHGDGRALPNVHTFNELMLAFYRDSQVDMVEELWIEMVRLNCTPKVCSYCILMAAYCDEGEMEKARNVWDELILKGLKPDVVAYNTLIGGYCRIGEVAKGEELYREMGLSGLEGTCVTCQHLLNGHCLARDVDSAMLLYNDMCRKGFSIDSSSIDLMVRVICDEKSVYEALGFFRNVMKNGDFVAKETSYEFVIKGLCGEGELEEALKLQAQMVGRGFKPNTRIYDAFIDGFKKDGKPDVAERLREEMVANQT